jgi:hypothetical protein
MSFTLVPRCGTSGGVLSAVLLRISLFDGRRVVPPLPPSSGDIRPAATCADSSIKSTTHGVSYTFMQMQSRKHTITRCLYPCLSTGEEVIILLNVRPRRLPLRIRIHTMPKPNAIIGRRPPLHLLFRQGPHGIQKLVRTWHCQELMMPAEL